MCVCHNGSHSARCTCRSPTRILLWELAVQSSGMFYQCCPNQALSFIIFLISKLKFFMGEGRGGECKVCMKTDQGKSYLSVTTVEIVSVAAAS